MLPPNGAMNGDTPPPASPHTEGKPAASTLGAALRTRLRHWLPRLGALLVVPLVLLGPALFLGKLFLPQAPVLYEPLALEHPEASRAVAASAHYWTGDRILPVLVDQLEFARRAEAGQGTGWETRLSLGLPLFGNAIHGPLYPPNLLLRAMDPARAAAPLAFLSLVLAGLGAWRFFERRGLPTGAAAVGALALQAAGFGALNLHYGMKVDAVLWLPFCLTALEDFGRRRRFSGLAVFVTAALPFTAGFPPIALFALAVAALYALVFLGPLRRPFGLAGEIADGSLPRALGLLVLAPLLAAPALWPAMEASGESLRVDKRAAELRAEALPITTLRSLLVPHLWGRPSDPIPGNRQPTVWWFTPKDSWAKAETASPLEWDAWTGAVLLGLAVLGFLRGGKRARFPALLLVLAFGFAQGWPVLRWLYYVPGFGAGAPSRALAVAWLAWAWLGALGTAALMERRPGARRVVVVYYGVVAALALIVASGIQPGSFGTGMEKRLAARYGFTVEDVRLVIDPQHTFAAARELERSVLDAAWLAGFGALAVLLGCIGAAGPRRRLPFALAAALVVDAVLVTSAHTRPLDVQAGTALFPASPGIDAVREAANGSRVWRLDRSPSAAEETVALARPNLLAAYGVRDVSAYVVFTPRRTVEYFTAIDPRTRFRSGVTSLTDPARFDHPMLDRADIAVVLALEPIDHPALELVHSQPRFAVHRRRGALGPARLARSASVEPDAIARLTRLVERTTDPRDVVLIEKPPPPEIVDEPAEDFARGAIAFTRPEPDRMHVAVTGGSAAWLVVHEAFNPGWRARVNGTDVEPFVADHAFLAVPVPAGGAQVEFVYRPASRQAPWLSVIALVLGLVLLYRPQARRVGLE